MLENEQNKRMEKLRDKMLAKVHYKMLEKLQNKMQDEKHDNKSGQQKWITKVDNKQKKSRQIIKMESWAIRKMKNRKRWKTKSRVSR